MRQAFAGMLWSKQFYHYVVDDWLDGRSAAARRRPRSGCTGRNHDWRHLYNADVLSMPDKWEYPWYAAWDLAFHCVPARARRPRLRQGAAHAVLREWYMHPNGQIPGLRVGVRRRQPAGARLGRAGAFTRSKRSAAASATASSSSASFTSCC